MTRRDFWTLALILLLGAGVTVAQRIHRGVIPLHIQMDGLEFLPANSYAFTETSEADLKKDERLEISAPRGDVEVTPWEEDKVRVEVRKQIRADSREAADRRSAELHLELVSSDVGLTARVTPRAGAVLPDGLVTDFSVFVPRNSRLLVATSHGDVRVQGIRGDLVIRTSHGDVQVSDIGGSCQVVDQHGAVTAARVTGALTVSTTHDDVTASGIDGASQVEAPHGNVVVTDSRGSVVVRSSHGEVTIARVGRDVRVEAPHSTVTIESVTAAVTVSVEADPVELRDVSGPVEVRADVTSVRLIDVHGKIRVDGRHTDVHVERPGNDVEVRTTEQEVELTPPAGRGFRLQATSEQGEIESDLPELVTPDEPVTTFSGTVGDGHSDYRLFTSHSTIRIHSPRNTAPAT